VACGDNYPWNPGLVTDTRFPDYDRIYHQPEIFFRELYEYSAMAKSWKEAKECAASEGHPFVYHDCDAETYGSCVQDEQQGSFRGGVFVEHRCICMPAILSEEELCQKEKAFREENPDW